MSTALVVGGTSGIGLATARRLRDRGATVHVVGRNEERLAAIDPDLVGHRADGADRAAIAAVAETIGTIDWLVITLSGAVLPARHVATADDIADVVVVAATNVNLTGTVIEADGGARLVSLG